jgi:4-hydroxy-3-polyprenylbenzoate decarboxylase
MRKYLSLLAERGQLRAISAQVDPRYEISAYLDINGAGPALKFERVAGSEMQVVGNLLCSRRRIALGLDCAEKELQGKIVAAIDKPINPRAVERAPCQEIIEEKPDLAKLPIPTFFEHETGPYITAGIIAARDAETGQANLSYARLKPLGGNRAFIGIAPNHHLAIMARRAGALPISVTLGNSPAVSIAAALYLGYGEDELRVAGALLGEGVEVAKCLSSEVRVPAHCEIVLEGTLQTEEMVDEGPVSEYHGMYENYGRGYVVEFSHLTRRRDAMLQVIQPGYAPEHVWIGGEAIAAGLMSVLRKSLPALVSVAITPGGAGRLHAVIALKNLGENEARKAMFAAWSAVNLIKLVTVVDEDVDPWDPVQVELALATRMRAERDVVVVPAMPTSRSDPLVKDGMVGKLGIDATTKAGDRADWKPAEPPAAVLERVRRRLT